jgi:hypothetical protein
MFRDEEECPDTRAVSVLHVEDDALVAEAVRMTLDGEGWAVETCWDSTAARGRLLIVNRRRSSCSRVMRWRCRHVALALMFSAEARGRTGVWLVMTPCVVSKTGVVQPGNAHSFPASENSVLRVKSVYPIMHDYIAGIL